MKVLFTADYHVKLKTKNIPDEWARNRFHTLFAKLAEIEESVDMHIVGGDFFDKLPGLEELELYYEFVATRRIRTFIIPGNHEALKKDTTFFSYLRNITSRINPLVQIVDQCYNYLGVDFLPYNALRAFEKNQKIYDFEGRILVTHVRGEIPPHVKPEIDLDLFKRWDVVLAGDLHSYDNCQRNIIYPGSPVTTSFHRNLVSNGYIILDTETLQHSFFDLELPQLIRKTIKAGEPMLPNPPHHVIYEVEGDMAQLASVEDHELMDKKVVKRSTEETALILSPEMTIEEEITEYLSFVLELPEETVEKAIATYHDHAKNFEMV